ncbi:hypothetical protein [Clostridium cylindrosporum]|nr:hypothetical protein [Clostridium cylindrosporum]
MEGIKMLLKIALDDAIIRYKEEESMVEFLKEVNGCVSSDYFMVDGASMTDDEKESFSHDISLEHTPQIYYIELLRGYIVNENTIREIRSKASGGNALTPQEGLEFAKCINKRTEYTEKIERYLKTKGIYSI